MGVLLRGWLLVRSGGIWRCENLSKDWLELGVWESYWGQGGERERHGEFAEQQAEQPHIAEPRGAASAADDPGTGGVPGGACAAASRACELSSASAILSVPALQ